MFHCNYVFCIVNEILSRFPKVKEVTWHITHSFRWYYTMRELVLLCVNQHTKFDVPSFTISRDMIGAKFKKMGHMTWPRLSSKAKHLTYSTCIQNLDTIASAILEIWLRVSKLKNGSCNTDHTPSGVVCHHYAGIWQSTCVQNLITPASAIPEIWLVPIKI